MGGSTAAHPCSLVISVPSEDLQGAEAAQDRRWDYRRASSASQFPRLRRGKAGGIAIFGYTPLRKRLLWRYPQKIAGAVKVFTVCGKSDNGGCGE